ncbi:MAG: Shikimate dehydrogenase (NADP(+)) [Candidatus Ordinivivax streblomastigis]|uniref:Shikimate dehydrogenase (NADP(+)) n=1 Tax=Candidatus Ordinivivax streblomastigis TaxID=2540710 RepID=A0A5M8P1S4_9BACT|nr:MAG: Shikimate dehydrogenase (NADP(+)) [Candidatus Ordinivivax streblomastigis]
MEQYGLIGYPLKHSFSIGFFNDKFAAERIDAEYVNFELASIKEVKAVLKEHPQLKGLNVTIPYKEQIIPYLDKLSDNAKLIGAVNVVKIERNKGKMKLTGYNSDIIGFKESIVPLLKPHHQSALVLGTGGAAKAVFYGLQQLGIRPVYVSRKKTSDTILTYSDFTPEVMAAHTLIVNCTPVGMWPNMDEAPNIPYELVTEKHLLYDLLYNPNETMFMKKGLEQGAEVKNGLEMLLLQAFASWDFWTK